MFFLSISTHRFSIYSFLGDGFLTRTFIYFYRCPIIMEQSSFTYYSMFQAPSTMSYYPVSWPLAHAYAV